MFVRFFIRCCRVVPLLCSEYETCIERRNADAERSEASKGRWDGRNVFDFWWKAFSWVSRKLLNVIEFRVVTALKLMMGKLLRWLLRNSSRGFWNWNPNRNLWEIHLRIFEPSKKFFLLSHHKKALGDRKKSNSNGFLTVVGAKNGIESMGLKTLFARSLLRVFT